MAGIYMAIKAELRLGPTSYMNDRLGGSSNVAAMIPTRRPPRPLSQCTTGHLPSIRVHMVTDRGIRVHADSPTLLYRLIEPPTPTYFALRLPLSWYSAPPTKLKKSHTVLMGAECWFQINKLAMTVRFLFNRLMTVKDVALTKVRSRKPA
mmetsp:Transcript_12848/g.46970  ORF Transcript_12848/g.46970 Transcript_12848/m.46970 type:complete len:150 (-) Transcript_12848:908-1357(-)